MTKATQTLAEIIANADLSDVTFTQLLECRATLDNEIRARESAEKAKAAKQVLELIRTHGLDIEQLKNNSAKGNLSRKPVEAKYQHPNDASLTWTGRGRKPLWVTAWIEEGKELDALLIK